MALGAPSVSPGCPGPPMGAEPSTLTPQQLDVCLVSAEGTGDGQADSRPLAWVTR